MMIFNQFSLQTHTSFSRNIKSNSPRLIISQQIIHANMKSIYIPNPNTKPVDYIRIGSLISWIAWCRWCKKRKTANVYRHLWRCFKPSRDAACSWLGHLLHGFPSPVCLESTNQRGFYQKKRTFKLFLYANSMEKMFLSLVKVQLTLNETAFSA